MLISDGWGALAWTAAAAALLYAVARLLARQTTALRPYARLRPVLLLAPLLVAALSPPPGSSWASRPGDGTLAQRIAAEPRYEGSSALLAWAVDGMAVLNGARAWALAWAEGEVGSVVGVWRIGAAFGQFWLLAGVFSGLLLPVGEGRRILRPSEADVPRPASASRAALAGFLLTIVTGALVSAVAQSEAWATLGQHPLLLAEAPTIRRSLDAGDAPRLASAQDPALVLVTPGLPTPSALREVLETERIGELACPRGTLAGVAAIDEFRLLFALAERLSIDSHRAAGRPLFATPLVDPFGIFSVIQCGARRLGLVALFGSAPFSCPSHHFTLSVYHRDPCISPAYVRPNILHQ
jgi:hypothetical protein